MVIIKYIGKTSNHVGKILWDILGNLKNFGVGRVVVRSTFERYEEKTFYRILSVEPQPTGGVYDTRKVKVFVEKTFRGNTLPEPELLFAATYKPDFRLLSKEEEVEYCKVDKVQPMRVLPNKIEIPPILKRVIFREYDSKGIEYDKHMKLEIAPRIERNLTYTFADSDDKEAFSYELDINTSRSPSLYENIKAPTNQPQTQA